MILAPFDKGQQDRLKLVDSTCQAQMEHMKKEMQTDRLLGKDVTPDMETVAWVEIITAYGLLYNRCVEAGWIDDTYLTNETESEIVL